MINFTQFDMFFGLTVLAILLVILRRRGRGFSYLFFFSVFWIYLLYVVSVILFPFPIFGDQTNVAFKPRINLIPFYFGSCEMLNLCIRDIVGNILLTIPFGFGISFITRIKAKDFVALAFAVGLTFECAQLLMSFVFKIAFRTIDINDVLLNATGVLIGYGFFKIFSTAYLKIRQGLNMKGEGMFAYVEEVARHSSQAT